MNQQEEIKKLRATIEQQEKIIDKLIKSISNLLGCTPQPNREHETVQGGARIIPLYPNRGHNGNE